MAQAHRATPETRSCLTWPIDKRVISGTRSGKFFSRPYTQISPLALSLIYRARDATYLSLVCDSAPSRMPTPQTSPPSAASSPACATPGAGTPSPWRCKPGARCPTSLPRRATTSATATSNAASPSSPGSTTPTKTALPKPAMAPQRQQSLGSRSSESFAWLNSTDPKEEGKPSREDGKPEEDPGSGGGEADPAAGGGEKVAGEGSYHGSSNTIAKGAAASAAAAAAKVDLPWPQTGESGKSIAESKGGEAEIKGEKESSDV